MRITYRTRGVKEYWAARWDDIPADAPMENLSVYPLKYAQMTVKDKAGKILEAGSPGERESGKEAGLGLISVEGRKILDTEKPQPKPPIMGWVRTYGTR